MPPPLLRMQQNIGTCGGIFLAARDSDFSVEKYNQLVSCIGFFNLSCMVKFVLGKMKNQLEKWGWVPRKENIAVEVEK